MKFDVHDALASYTWLDMYSCKKKV